MNNLNLIQVPDQRYKVWLDTSLKSIKLAKPNKEILQVFKDTWHPQLDNEYISKCLGEPLRASNLVTRMVYYVTTIDMKGNVKEGFVPLPKYVPQGFRTTTSNPRIHFLYKVNNQGLFYFK